MRRRPTLILALTCGVVAAALAAPARGAPDRPDPFVDTAIAPDDLTAFVHIADAAEFRRHLADRPVAEWLGSLVEDGQLAAAWQSLARQAGLRPEALLDLYFARRVTIMVRRGARRGSTTEWVLLTEVDLDEARMLATRLQPRILRARGSVRLYEVPEHELLLARTDRGRILMGPRQRSGLFYDVVDRIGRPGAESVRRRPCLAVHEAVIKGRDLGRGDAALLLRHEAPMGGWSVAVATLRQGRIDLRHAARFDNSPFKRRISRLLCDCSPVAAFEDRTLLTIMEPRDVGDGPIETYLARALGQPSLSSAVAERLGDRRIVSVGEVEGRAQDDPVDLESTTVAFCLEVRDPEGLLPRLDEHMVTLAEHLEEAGAGEFDLRIDAPHGDGPRTIDLGPAAAWLAGGCPVLRNLSLNWTIADSPHGLWCVIASHPDHLRDVVRALEEDVELVPPALIEHVGTANGERIGRHLLSWSDSDDLIGDAAEVAAFRQSLRLLSAISSGVQRCRWTAVRPSQRELRLDIQMILSPPRSSGPVPAAETAALQRHFIHP